MIKSWPDCKNNHITFVKKIAYDKPITQTVSETVLMYQVYKFLWLCNMDILHKYEINENYAFQKCISLLGRRKRLSSSKMCLLAFESRVLCLHTTYTLFHDIENSMNTITEDEESWKNQKYRRYCSFHEVVAKGSATLFIAITGVQNSQQLRFTE